MDPSILSAEERLAYLAGDEDTIDLYRRRFMAMCDYTSEMNYACDQAQKEGRTKERQRILELINQGLSIEELKQRL